MLNSLFQTIKPAKNEPIVIDLEESMKKGPITTIDLEDDNDVIIEKSVEDGEILDDEVTVVEKRIEKSIEIIEVKPTKRKRSSTPLKSSLKKLKTSSTPMGKFIRDIEFT